MNFKVFAKLAVIFCGLILGTSKTAVAKTDHEQDDWLATNYNLSVPQGVKWQKRKVPFAIQKTLKKGAKIIKCGVADIGPQGATRWVLAWRTGTLDNYGKGEIYLSVFSQEEDRYLKSSERNVGNRFVRSIRLYWLQPASLSGPVVCFGDTVFTPNNATFGQVDLVVFPDGWQNQMFSQKFEWFHFHPSDVTYSLPFIDDKGVLCVVSYDDFQDSDKFERAVSVMHWKGKGWS